jgi:hypothetical protein
MLNGDYEASELWRTVNCEELGDFRDQLDILRKYCRSSRILYRGHRDATWYLRSTWEQRFRSKDPQKAGLYEIYKLQDPKRELFSKHLCQFRSEVRRQSLTFTNLDDIATLDALAALGRHHGLCTPLLDWTTDPDVAVYFAFRHQDREDEQSAAIWELCLEEQLRDNGHFCWGNGRTRRSH